MRLGFHAGQHKQLQQLEAQTQHLSKQAPLHVIQGRGVRFRACYQSEQLLEIFTQLVYHVGRVERHGHPPENECFGKTIIPENGYSFNSLCSHSGTGLIFDEPIN